MAEGLVAFPAAELASVPLKPLQEHPQFRLGIAYCPTAFSTSLPSKCALEVEERSWGTLHPR